MTVKKLTLLTFPVAAFLVVAFAPSIVLAGPNQDTAKGRVNQFGTLWDFSAKSSATGFNASGSVRVTQANSDPNQVFTGEVTCLRVVAATATTPATAFIGGVITNAPPGSFASSFVITASDSGKFSNVPDTFNGFVSSSPPPPDGGCPTSGFGSPVADGEIIIDNALP
jgi:hypothetical protein